MSGLEMVVLTKRQYTELKLLRFSSAVIKMDTIRNGYELKLSSLKTKLKRKVSDRFGSVG